MLNCIPQCNGDFWSLLITLPFLLDFGCACLSRAVPASFSEVGVRPEIEFQYTKELLFCARFVGQFLDCFCKCLPPVPVNPSVFSRNLSTS